tara:strand:+ start:14952 stop:15365 length:414 start_codon:yes stop_codon:yes gene_type:complete
MRVIKFRVYSTVTGSFDFVSIEELMTSDNSKISLKGFNEDLTVMQFTGLQDKHGVDIYEGDIVTGKYDNLDVDYCVCGAVEWGKTSDSDGWICGETIGWVTSNGSSLLDLVDYKGCEVIGNIYQNPELLEKQIKGSD